MADQRQQQQRPAQVTQATAISVVMRPSRLNAEGMIS